MLCGAAPFFFSWSFQTIYLYEYHLDAPLMICPLGREREKEMGHLEGEVFLFFFLRKICKSSMQGLGAG